MSHATIEQPEPGCPRPSRNPREPSASPPGSAREAGGVPPEPASIRHITQRLAVVLCALVTVLALFQAFDAPSLLPRPGEPNFHLSFLSGTVGALIAIAEPFAFFAAAAAAVLVRKRTVPLVLTVIATLCLAGMIAVWGTDIVSLNLVVRNWEADRELPGNWTELRAAWEWFHLLRAGLALAALSALLSSLIFDAGSDAADGDSAQAPSQHTAPPEAAP